MSQLTENLESLCREEPSKCRNIIITLSEASQDLKANELGIDNVEEIPGLPGIFKGCLTGEKILELINHEKIEEISEDSEEYTLSTE